MEAEIISRTRENLTLSASENDVLHSDDQSTMVTEIPAVCVVGGNGKSKVTSASPNRTIDGTVDAYCALGAETNSKLLTRRGYLKLRNGNFPLKNKRKQRRRGKPKSNTKPYKKSNWKFQKPRVQQDGNNGGGSSSARNGERSKLVRSRSIVPYNTNDFLMEEHMADVPGARHTPSGRTRDSSFSVDSEDNYFFSMPEDEEEFLTKEFANVYERARVERLESMTKEQLVEECLQLEHKYADGSPTGQVTGNGATEFINRIRILEERIRALSTENIDLRRRLERRNNANNKHQQTTPDADRMCSSTSEDSESDSTSSSCSSRSDYSGHSRRSSISDDDGELGDVSNERNVSSRMDSDDIIVGVTDQSVQNLSNGPLDEHEQNVIVCNGFISTTNGPLSPSQTAVAAPLSSHQPEQQQQQLSPAQESQQHQQQQ